MTNNLDIRNFIISIFYILFRISVISGHPADENNHNVVKRMEIETCLGRFDVHHDMIIRTEESRTMGAKFLDYADLGSREECLRLCCETDGCDVFVVEEKSQGTCFLFQCGPPENFRCKFTRHANYTSAVLTQQQQQQTPVVQPQTPVQPHPPQPPVTQSPVNSLSQNEIELTSLRVGGGAPYLRDAIQITTTTVKPQQVTTKAIETKAVEKTSSLCSRFQFQCHSGECIAVYNACDGIPQCEDGSDEGPECPVATTKFPLKPIVSKLSIHDNIPPPRDMISQNMDDLQKPKIPPAIQRPYTHNQQQQYQHPQIDTIQQQQQQQPQSSGQRPPTILHNREDPMSSPPKQQWTHQSSNDAPAAYNMIDSSDSHIFNHKGGLQLAANNVVSQYENTFNNGAPNTYPMQIENQDLYRNQLIQQQQQQQQQTQLQQQQWMNDRHYGAPPQSPQQSPIGNNWPAQSSRQDVEQQQLNSLQMQAPPSNKNDWPNHPAPPIQGDAENSENQSKKLAKSNKKAATKARKKSQSESNAEEEDDYEEQTAEEEEKPTETPPKKSRKHKKQPKAKDNSDDTVESTKIIKNKSKDADKPLREQLKMLKGNLDLEFADHDGAAERPSGAVLSLTLGVLIAAALAVLIGCRMRAVGRRVRRHGKSAYAHDADFLVNGMYL